MVVIATLKLSIGYRWWYKPALFILAVLPFLPNRRTLIAIVCQHGVILKAD